MTVQFDFTSQDFLRDPAARLERLRAFGPVVEVRFPIIIGKTWITTTQEAADLMLKDSRTFTLRREGGEVAGLRWWMPGIVRTLANNMLTTDEPDHTRLRSMVDEAFRRRRRRHRHRHQTLAMVRLTHSTVRSSLPPAWCKVSSRNT